MFEKIAKTLSEQLDIDISKITPDSEIVKDLGADSLDMVEMLMNLQDELGITIPEEKIADLKTVGDVAKLLESL